MSTEPTESCALRGEVAELERAFAFIEGFCARREAPDSVKFKLFLVCEELMMNAIKHGYRSEGAGPIFLNLTNRDEGVALRFEDEAPAFDVFDDSATPDLDADVEERKIGGLGVHLIKTLCRTSEYRREGARNVVEAVVAAEADADADRDAAG